MNDETLQTEDSVAGNTTARAVVEAVFRHRGAFWGTFWAVMALAALVTASTPRMYESEMEILVRNARPDYLITPERSTGQIMQTDVTEERVGSEMDVLKSRDIADVVVDPRWEDQPMSARTDAEIKAHGKEVNEFDKHLTVEALKKSNVIRVGYVTGDGRQAQAALDRLLAAFLGKQREMERSTGTSNFFASEAARYKRELDRAQQQLSAFQQSNELVSLPAREATLESQLNSLDDGVRAAQVQMTEAANRVASDRRQLQSLPERQPTAQQSVPNTQAVEQLTAILATYVNKRTELMTRYQASDPLVVEVNQQIADTRMALRNAREMNGQASTTDVNPVYEQVKEQLSTSTADLAAARGRLADLTGQRERLQRQLNRVEGSTVEFTTLQARVAELQNNFELYTQKKNEAGIADAMDQKQLVNVAVAERPTYSAKRYSPHYGISLGLGLFTGVFLGGCAVFFAEAGRDTISAPWELEAISRAPVLATVPLEQQGVAPAEGRRGAQPVERKAGEMDRVMEGNQVRSR